MKIVLKNITLDTVRPIEEMIGQVADSVIAKLILESPELEGRVSVDSVDIDALVKLRVEGMEETQLLFTDRMLTPDMPEVLTLLPQFDDYGQLAILEDNLNESFNAPLSQMMEDIPTEEIVSEYDTSTMEKVGHIDFDEIGLTTYKMDSGEYLEQYTNNGVLVAELVTKEKADHNA